MTKWLLRGAFLPMICAVIVSGCGSGGSGSSSLNIGGSIQQAFLSTLDSATSGNGTTSYAVQFTIYRCEDQNSGVPLDQLTTGDLEASQGDMLFHCELTRNVSSNFALAPSGSDGWLYYLDVKTGGKWDGQWEPLPVTSQDQIPPCSGALCNETLGKGPPDHVAGNENSGHVVGSQSASTSSATNTATSQEQNSGSSGNTGEATTTTPSNPASSTPTSSTTTPTGASQDCGSFASGSGSVRVSVTGSVSCPTALRVMRDSMAGKGKALGQGLASGTDTDGWTCSYGMGVRTCQLGKASITGKF